MTADAKVVITAQDQTAAAFASLKGNLGAAKGSIDSLASNIGNLGGLLAASIGGLSIAGFANMVKGGIESAAAMHDLAIQTGTTVEALSGLASIGKFSGISAETIGASMNKLAKNMAGATEESRGAGKAIEALGIDFGTFKQLDPAQQMQTVAKALDGFQDGASKSAISMALFGKEGAQLLPMMKDLAVAGDLQAKITGEQAAMADNFSDNLTRVKASSEGWKKELTMGMLPALDTAAQAFVNVMNGTGGVRDEIKKLSADGTLKEWTQSAITGLTYVMDAGSGVVRVFESVGKVLGALLATNAAFYSGRFSEIPAIWKEFGSDMDKAWTSQTMGQKLRDQIANLNATGAAVKATADAAEKAKPKLDFTNIMEKNKKAADEFRTLWDKIFAKDSGVEADFNKNINILKEALYSGRISLDQYIESVKTYSAQQKYAVEAAKAFAANEEAARKWLDANDKTLESLIAGNEKLREQNEVIGLTVEQTNALTLARADAAIAQAELNLVEAQNIEGNEARINQIEREISLLRQRRDLIATGQEKTAAVEAARLAEKAAADAASAWQKYTDQINQSLTDALMNGFTAGKGFAKSFTDSVKAMFNTMVLRPVISAIVTPVGTAATSLLGFSGAASAGQGVSSLSTLGSLASIGGSLGTFGNGLSAGFGSLLGEAGLAGGVDAGIIALQAGNMAGGLGTLAGALGPIAAFAAAVYAASKYVNNTTPHSGGGSQYSATGGTATTAEWVPAVTSMRDQYNATTGEWTGQAEFTVPGYWKQAGETFAGGFTGIVQDQATVSMTSSIAKGIVGLLDNTAVTFGKAAGFQAATSFADDSSKDGAWGSLRIADAVGNVLTDWQASASFRTFSDGQAGITEYQSAIAADVRAALKQIDLPAWAADMLAAIGDTPDLTTLAQGVAQITLAKQALDALGQKMAGFATMSDAAVSALVKAAGGIESLVTAANTYYDNFYSDAERTAATLGQVGEQLAAFGLVLPTTRDSFRAMVEQQQAAGNGEAVAALLRVSGAFASVVPAAESAADAVVAVADTVRASAAAMLEQARASSVSRVEYQRLVARLRAPGAVGPAYPSSVYAANGETTTMQTTATPLAAPTVDAAVVSAINALRGDFQTQIDGLRAETRAIVGYTGDTARGLARVTEIDMLRTTAAT